MEKEGEPMNYKAYHNCLRVQITPDGMQDERIAGLVEHCVRYGFDNVMLCINQEEFNVGHITLEMAKPWVAVLKKAADALRKQGITVSINNWMEIGHADRGRAWFKGQSFQGFVDMNGREAKNIACPLCEQWLSYFIEYAEYLVKEIRPDTFWIEDDFRLHNHSPLFGVGCYCKKHMAMYNDRLGTNYSREELLERAFSKGPLNREREVWLDVNRDVMLSLADRLGRAIKNANPNTDVALMSSRPAAHCMEARDWHRLLSALSQGGTQINRVHLPYGELSGKEFLYQINSQSMAIRAMTDDDVVIMPEIEHGSATFFAKTPRYLRYTLEASIPLVLSGTTYSIYGFHANGARDSFRFGDVVADLQSYMQAIRDLNLRFSRMKGVTVPICERAAYYKNIQKDYNDLAATEYCAAGYLGGLGISYRYSREREFVDEALFLTGSNADYFTDAELKKLFLENFIIGDATLAMTLAQRGLLSLIGARSVSMLDGENGEYTYEECRDENTVICGVRKLRASARVRCLPPCAKVEYHDDIEILTGLYDFSQNAVCAGMARGKRFLMLPFMLDRNEYAMYDDLRRHFIIETLGARASAFSISDSVGVSSYLYKREIDHVLMLVNGNVDGYSPVCVRVRNVSFERVMRLTREGELVNCSFTRNGDLLILDDTLEYLSTNVYLLQ